MKRITIKWWPPVVVMAISALFWSGAVRAEESGFEELSLAGETEWNGSERWNGNNDHQDGTFTSEAATFNNHYDQDYDFPYWDCWAYSRRTDPATTGPAGQYTAMPGCGAGGSRNYGVAYLGFYGRTPTITFAEDKTVQGACFTNNAYAYHSMETGDDYAKRFGGPTDDDKDWFLLTITGKDENDDVTGTVEFYLADYRFQDNTEDYIVDEWTWVGLTSLGDEVRKLEFALSSSDNDPIWGMNTPAYFAMDGLVAVAEPSTILMILSAALCLGVLKMLTSLCCGKGA